MATTEDFSFSFPTIGDSSCPYAIDSPPLWNLSPVTSPNPYQGFREGNNEDKVYERGCFEGKLITDQGQRKSFSYIENGRKRRGGGGDYDDYEKNKMDLLWEDFNFNEELSSTTGSATSTSRSEEVELRCDAGLTLAKSNKNGALLQSKNKPGMVVFVKVLKKFFSLSNSQGKPRKRVG